LGFGLADLEGGGGRPSKPKIFTTEHTESTEKEEIFTVRQ
jgi:hypothetical protein